jgi:hypothetical protein
MPAVLAVISAAAGVIKTITSIFGDDGQIEARLNDILQQLQALRNDIVTVTTELLEAINGVHLEVDRQVALDAMSLVDRALYNDAVPPGNEVQALGNSYQGADRLFLQTDIVFLSSFLYVGTIRLAVLKQVKPSYVCEARFVDEYQKYINKANGWLQRLNDSITASHTVKVVAESRGPRVNPQFRWVATHFRHKVVVQRFVGAWGDDSEETQAHVTQQANDSRARGIQRERQDSGVVDMENTVQAWREAFHGALRAALVREVLNRPTMAIVGNADGLMVDGRMLPVGLDLRTTLLDLLSSREFHHRIHKAWEAFLYRGDDRLAQFAHRRLLHREATGDEMALLRGIASHWGYAAFIAVLLHGTEYEERYGRGLPGSGKPLLQALELAD